MNSYDDLLSELNNIQRKQNRMAIFLECIVDICWWVSVVAAALASASGLIHYPPYLPFSSSTISILAAVASGAELLRRNAKWREKSNAHYAYRDATRKLAWRLKYEIQHPVTPDQLASISYELREAQDNFGNRISKINAERDNKSNKIDKR